eukprot:1363629-Amorphochlora_amoeboformis.AAC.1
MRKKGKELKKENCEVEIKPDMHDSGSHSPVPIKQWYWWFKAGLSLDLIIMLPSILRRLPGKRLCVARKDVIVMRGNSVIITDNCVYVG